MKITKQEIINLKPCHSGLLRFLEQTDYTEEPVNVNSLVGGKNTYSDLIWLAGKLLSREELIKFACKCALINIESTKQYFKPHDLIMEFLKNPTGSVESKIVMAAAINAADKADSVGDLPALLAIYAISYAAQAAGSQEDFAAYTTYAVEAICDIESSEQKINELLIELFEGYLI